MSIDMRSVPDL